jgi:hypothetical protein
VHEGVAIEPSKSGAPTARLNGVLLHSRYDPRREARRFIEEKLGDETTLALLLGESLGYLSEAIAELRPNCRVIALYCSADLFEHRVSDSGSAWHPGSCPVADFLEEEIAERELSGLEVFEWPPVQRALGEAYAPLIRAVYDQVASMNANIVTTEHLGRRWFTNSVRNSVSIPSLLRVEKGNCPVVVAAAGPSLEHSISLLRSHRDRYFLCALTASLSALRLAGIEPDLLVATDAGYYAGEHLRTGARGDRHIPIAMPLTARPPSGTRATLLLAQETPVEQGILNGGTIPALRAPMRGTVAITAIELAAVLSSGPTLVCGLDFAALDIQEHARPHAFDAVFASKARRTAPEHSVRTQRVLARYPERLTAGAESRTWRSGRSFRSYAEWTERRASRFTEVFRLEASPVSTGMPDLSKKGAERLFRSALSGRPVLEAAPAAGIRTAAKAYLLRLSRDLEQIKKGEGETESLLEMIHPVKIGKATQMRRLGRVEEADRFRREALESLVRLLDSSDHLLGHE